MRTGLTYDDNDEKNKIPEKQHQSSLMKMENHHEYNYMYGMGANEYYNLANNYSVRKREQKS